MSALPEAYHEGLREVYREVQQCQRSVAGLKGEAELGGPELKPMVDTLGRKANALGHILEDLATIPEEVAGQKAALERRRQVQGS